MARINNKIIITDIQYRPCYIKGKKALFHKYIETTDILLKETTHALVEYEDGQVDKVVPTLIKFCDNKIKGFVFKECNDEKNNK